MKSKVFLITAISLLIIFMCTEYINASEKLPVEWGKFLKTAKIVAIEKDLEMGRTDFWIVALDDGSNQRKAAFKYLDRCRPHPVPDSYKYEIAAYELNKLLSLDLVPPTVFREIEGMPGSLQLYLSNVISATEQKRENLIPPDTLKFENDMAEMKIVENLAYSITDQQADILFDKDTWQVFRIDFSEAFAPVHSLLPLNPIDKCSRKTFEKLSKLKKEIIVENLKEYLNDEEIAALLIRIDLVLKELKQQIEIKGADAVLFNK